MPPENRRPPLRLVAPLEPDLIALDGDDLDEDLDRDSLGRDDGSRDDHSRDDAPVGGLPGADPGREPTAAASSLLIDGSGDRLDRIVWSMRLHALLGEEVARAIDADVLTLAEAEVLLARLAVVIDQAVGAGEN